MFTSLPFNPAMTLGALVGLTVLATVIEDASRSRRKRQLRELAARWKMNYSQRDLLHMASRVATRFPIAGASDFHVCDVIYGSEGANWRYVLTVEYTSGIVTGRHRQVRVASFTEPRDRSGGNDEEPIALASNGLPLLDQYRSMGPKHVCDVS